MTKPTDKVIHVAMDSQSVAGHKLTMQKSLATAHQASLLKPAQSAQVPATQQSSNTGEKTKK